MTQTKKNVINNQDLADIHAEYIKAFKKIEKITADVVKKIVINQDREKLEKIRIEIKK